MGVCVCVCVCVYGGSNTPGLITTRPGVISLVWDKDLISHWPGPRVVSCCSSRAPTNPGWVSIGEHFDSLCGVDGNLFGTGGDEHQCIVCKVQKNYETSHTGAASCERLTAGAGEIAPLISAVLFSFSR